jgi:rubredoxin
MNEQSGREEQEEVDALCPECGHAFKKYVDRLVSGTRESGLDEKIECPVCGCGKCEIIRPGT